MKEKMEKEKEMGNAKGKKKGIIHDQERRHDQDGKRGRRGKGTLR